MTDFSIPIIYLGFIIFSIVVIIITAVKSKKYYSKFWDKTVVFEIIFMIIGPAIGFARYDDFGFEIPFNTDLDWLLIIPVYFVIFSYFLSKYARVKNLVKVSFVSAVSLSLGLIITLITSIHFGGYIATGIVFPVFGFELVSPVICTFLLIKELIFIHQFQVNQIETMPEPYGKIAKTPFIPKLGFGLLGASALLVVYQLILLAFGYGSTALIDIYSSSHNFTFSNLIK